MTTIPAIPKYILVDVGLSLSLRGVDQVRIEEVQAALYREYVNGNTDINDCMTMHGTVASAIRLFQGQSFHQHLDPILSAITEKRKQDDLRMWRAAGK